ncbi:hypothetical protein HNR18_001415 [Pseudoclavibacter caeni]|nr:hypothetical protein [Pseudoclavibacter caeni]
MSDRPNGQDGRAARGLVSGLQTSVIPVASVRPPS